MVISYKLRGNVSFKDRRCQKLGTPFVVYVTSSATADANKFGEVFQKQVFDGDNVFARFFQPPPLPPPLLPTATVTPAAAAAVLILLLRANACS